MQSLMARTGMISEIELQANIQAQPIGMVHPDLVKGDRLTLHRNGEANATSPLFCDDRWKKWQKGWAADPPWTVTAVVPRL